MLTVCPPETSPTFTVVPRVRSVIACSAMILRASSSIALMPSVNLPPECAALPVISIFMNTPPLRPVTTLPLGRPGSELNTARARRASASMIGRHAGEPISSSDGEQADQRRGRAAELLERREHERVHHQARLHVGDARPIGAAVLDPERAARRLALGKHRVAMAHQHDGGVRRPADGRAQRVAIGLVRDRLAGDLVALEESRMRAPTASTPALS